MNMSVIHEVNILNDCGILKQTNIVLNTKITSEKENMRK